MYIRILYIMQYDNVLMEESAQILEIETFIPLMLQVNSHSCHLVFVFVYLAAVYVHSPIILNSAESSGWIQSAKESNNDWRPPPGLCVQKYCV